MEDAVGLERFNSLDEGQATMQAEPFPGVAMPLDIEAVAGDPIEACERRCERRRESAFIRRKGRCVPRFDAVIVGLSR
jgi:hypothetical protein